MTTKKMLEIEFRNEHLSVSRLKKFEVCPRAFYYRYVEPSTWSTAAREVMRIDGAPVEVTETTPADFGVVLHAALERTVAWVLSDEYEGPWPEEILIANYKAAWTESGHTGLALFDEGLKLCRGYARAQAPISFHDVLAVEQEFNIDVGGYVVNGYIDRVDRLGDDGIEIIDYKSNRQPFTKDELANDLQMSVYGIAARKLYPWAKVVAFSFHMLRFGDLVQRTRRTPREIDDAAAYVTMLGNATEATDVEWKPKLNENCSTCESRSRCPMYERALAGKHEVTKADTNDLDDLAREREECANLAKALYARKAKLDDVLKAELKKREPVRIGGRVYTMIQQNEKSYDAAKIVAAFVAAGADEKRVRDTVFEANGAAIEALRVELIESMPRDRALMLKTNIEAAMTKTPATPRLDSKPDKSIVSQTSRYDSGKKGQEKST